MNRFLIFCILLITSMNANAVRVGSLKERVASYKCQKEITKMTKAWQGTGDWKGHVSQEGGISLKRPTTQFAHWLLLEKLADVETLTLINPLNAQKLILDKKCQGTLTAYNHKQFSNNKGLNDEKLLKELMQNKKGIIVLWSPGMNHSFTAMKRLKKIAEEKKLSISFIMDPFADIKVAEEALKKNGIEIDSINKLSSLELMYRDATMHYPNFFLYKDSTIVSNVIPGLMGENNYRNKITQYLGK